MSLKVLLACLIASAAVAVSEGAGAATGHAVVRVTILPNLNMTFAPKTVKHGKVVFEVTNRSAAAHWFHINGVTSAAIGPGRTRSVAVTFKRAAIYEATLADCGYLSLCTGDNPDTGPVGSINVS
jgi:hypothetical protein